MTQFFREPSYTCTRCREHGEPSEWCPGHDGLVIIDDIQTGAPPLTEDQAAALKEWADLQVAAGNVSIGTIRLPDGDLLKSLLDRADTES